jgi:hypothetical protein
LRAAAERVIVSRTSHETHGRTVAVGRNRSRDSVEAELRRTTPDVLERVQFDSEADAFCIYAHTRDDVRAVSTALETLARPRKRPAAPKRS